MRADWLIRKRLARIIHLQAANGANLHVKKLISNHVPVY